MKIQINNANVTLDDMIKTDKNNYEKCTNCTKDTEAFSNESNLGKE